MLYAKLKGRIREVCRTQDEFARRMGLDHSTTNQKLNGKSPWKRDEIAKACRVLEVPIEHVHEYFFYT